MGEWKGEGAGAKELMLGLQDGTVSLGEASE